MLLLRSSMVNLRAHIEQRVCLWESAWERERERERERRKRSQKIFLVYEDNVRRTSVRVRARVSERARPREKRAPKLSGSLRSCHWRSFISRVCTCVCGGEHVCVRERVLERAWEIRQEREREFAPLPRVAYAGRHLWLGGGGAAAVSWSATGRYHDQSGATAHWPLPMIITMRRKVKKQSKQSVAQVWRGRKIDSRRWCDLLSEK